MSGWRHAPQPGVDLPGAHPAGAARLDHDQLGDVGDQPQGCLYGSPRPAPASSGSKSRSGSRPAPWWRGCWAPRHERPARAPPVARAGPPGPARSRARQRSGRAPGTRRTGRRGSRAHAGEARSEARRSFGGILQMKERHRDARSARWLEHAATDAARGLASLPRSGLHPGRRRGAGARHRRQHRDVQPGGRRALQAAAVPRPRTHRAHLGDADADHQQLDHDPQLRRAQQQSRSFEAFSAESASTATVPVNGEPMRLTAATCRRITSRCSASSRYRPHVPARRGPAGRAEVVMLSHAAWQQHFGGDPGILGRDCGSTTSRTR